MFNKSKIVIYSLILTILPQINADEEYFFNYTKFSGDIQYRFDREGGRTSLSKLSDTDINIKTVSTINDNLSLNAEILFESDYYHEKNSNNLNDFDIENLYLQHKSEAFEINVGRVVFDGPFTDNVNGNGFEIDMIGTKNFKMLLNYYHNNSIREIESAKTMQAALIGNFSAIHYELWRAKQSNLELNNITLAAKTDVINFTAMHSWAKYKDASNLSDRPTLTKLDLNIKYGYIYYNISAAATNREPNYVSLDKSVDAKVNYGLWQLDLKDKEDSYLGIIDIAAIVYPKVKLRGAYAKGKTENFKSSKEFLGEISYDYSKKIKTYLRGSKYVQSEVVANEGAITPEKYNDVFYKLRFEIKYTF